MSVYDEAGIVSAGEPVPVDPVTEEEMNAISTEKLELLGKSLAKTRDRWIAARIAAGVERRWMEDTDQYLGRDDATKQASSMMDTIEHGGASRSKPDQKVQRSTVFVNITRPKTNAVEARLANMLYPSDDLAWGIKPTPNPKLSILAKQQAQELARMNQLPPGGAPQQGPQQMSQPTPQQVPGVAGGIQPNAGAGPQMTQMAGAIQQLMPKTPAREELDVAAAKAKAMQDEIHDALTECDFNAIGRKVLHDVAMLGTGVLKGPIIVNRVAKVWKKVEGSEEGVHALEIVSELKPASEYVSPWHVYPDPTCGDNIHHGKGIYEKRNMTGKMLRELVKQPGYMEEQIAKVLEEGPRRITTMNERDRRDELAMNGEPMYECWEYWGEFDPEDLRSCGVDVPDSQTKLVSGCVIMVNDTVIKGFLNPLECGSVPYDFMVLEKGDNSPWGYGVPYLCRPAQRVLNAAWRQMMDNAGLSVGPNVIVKPNMIKPADGNWAITGRKLWNCTDDSADLSRAVHVFNIDNNTQQFQVIIEMALRFADEETSVPKIAEGSAHGAPDSVGGLTMQMNSANVVLGRLVKQYDDMITRPHIRRYYDFFMAYSDKPEIKGDFQVDARGSSVLLVRDQQMQSMLQLGQFQGTQIGQMIRWPVWVREIFKMQNLNHAELLKSDAEIEEILNQPPGPSPEQVKAETAIKVAEMRAQAQLETAKANEQGELAFANAQAQMARDNAIASLKQLEMKRDLEILKYANQEKITLEKVKADLAKTSLIEETKRQIAAAKIEQEALENDKSRAVQPRST